MIRAIKEFLKSILFLQVRIDWKEVNILFLDFATFSTFSFVIDTYLQQNVYGIEILGLKFQYVGRPKTIRMFTWVFAIYWKGKTLWKIDANLKKDEIMRDEDGDIRKSN